MILGRFGFVEVVRRFKLGAEEFIDRRSFGVWRRYRRVGVDFGEVIVRIDLGLGSLV